MTEPPLPQARSADSPRLNVLIVSQPVDGGVAVCARQLAEAALAAGHRPTVVSPAEADAPFAAEAIRMGARHVTLLDHQRTPQLRDALAVFALRRLMRDSDVVHLHSSKAGAVGRIAGVFLGRKRPPIVFTPHAWSWLVGRRSATLYRVFERVLARACDVIVAVSASEAAEGRRVLRRTSRRMIVIENGIDLERFAPEGPRAMRDPAPLLVCVGRLTRQKGQDVALRAMAAMKTKDVRIRFVGDGNREELVALARQLGIEDRVEWTGSVTDAAPHFRAADVVVAPSRWEGMSLVFLEAMACGVALVATEVQGAEAVDDAGVLVPSEDHDALARELDTLLADPTRRRDLGRNGRLRSRAYDVNRSNARNIGVWERLAVGDLSHRDRGSTPA